MTDRPVPTKGLGPFDLDFVRRGAGMGLMMGRCRANMSLCDCRIHDFRRVLCLGQRRLFSCLSPLVCAVPSLLVSPQRQCFPRHVRAVPLFD